MAGSFALQTRVDLTVEAILPERAEDLVVNLRSFSTNPAHTMFDAAADAGVPAVAALRAALPAPVEAKLEGWINEEIARQQVGGVPVTQIAGDVAALATTALTRFGLDSTLAIAGDTATHQLTTISLAPAGVDLRFALGAAPREVLSSTASSSLHAGQLAIGDHRYAFAYGEYVWRALDQVITARYGRDLRATLGTAVGCPTLAARVAKKCVVGRCVGHETALIEICERGLDKTAERFRANISGLRIEALHLTAGTVHAVDDDGDGDVERLEHGVWTAAINAGQGLRPVPATFVGVR